MRFVVGEQRVVIEPQIPMRRAPAPDAALDTEALMGERVTIYDTNGEGWVWGQLANDGYVGWMPASGLGTVAAEPTHKVSALRALVFPGPSIKLPPIASLPFGACVTIAGAAERFAVTDSGGYIPVRHVAPLASVEDDFVAVAQRFLGTPYLWGGKTSLGLDCSGLAQVALAACGIVCPRDSDMQEQVLGVSADANAEFSNLRRGDLVFWKGHMGIVRDPGMLLHANAFHMAVALEPISEAIPRIHASDGAPTAVRRL